MIAFLRPLLNSISCCRKHPLSSNNIFTNLPCKCFSWEFIDPQMCKAFRALTIARCVGTEIQACSTIIGTNFWSQTAQSITSSRHNCLNLSPISLTAKSTLSSMNFLQCVAKSPWGVSSGTVLPMSKAFFQNRAHGSRMTCPFRRIRSSQNF